MSEAIKHPQHYGGESNVKNIIGSVYGSFIITKLMNDIDSRRGKYYLLTCSCGKHKYSRFDHIKNGAGKYCSCVKTSPLRIDISNQKFGKLTAIKRVSSPGTKHFNHWECICDCGKKCIVGTGTLRADKQKSCGCYSGNRKGNGRKGKDFKTKSGYIMKYFPNHPSRKRSYIFEHRYVMEKMIGRYLLGNETVHHKNGVRDDNRPENLELWASQHLPGQRVEDLIKFAIELLEMYKPELLHNGK